ncbi:MAG: glutamine-hydrolyzing carbamoyl-phosphate synthase small subunit [Gemmatimonadota bacterium]|nr:MAG: glutamine-hydrolyzing carbamoyl-phosphate synthase small subunit [Gemmatimonadota bacterium]
MADPPSPNPVLRGRVKRHLGNSPAYLLLEDGRRFEGRCFGAPGSALGEVVFNTAMTGYQEVLTDPSYSGQLVCMTFPLIGNYGVNEEDEESPGPKVSGFIVREVSEHFSSLRASESLQAYLSRHGIVALSEIDTRALTLHIRAGGAMRGGIAPVELPEEELLERILEHPRMEGLDLAHGVSTVAPYEVRGETQERFHVLAYDFGVKASSPALLAQRGCRVTVIPADTSADEIVGMAPDGLFISNGPGDPEAVDNATEAIRRMAEKDIPVFGICLGHQLIARAFGATTFKLPFGHHGTNHPVRNLDENMVEITSQNHGFAVLRGDGDELPGAPDLRLTHVNLYDDTVEGLAHRSRPVFSVQYHPEAAPGPHDSRYLFDQFIDLMVARVVT